MAIDPLPGQDTLIEFRGKLPDDLTPAEISALTQAIESLLLEATRAADVTLDSHPRVFQPTLLRLEYGSDLLQVFATIAVVAGAVKLVTGSVKDVVDIIINVRGAAKPSGTKNDRSAELTAAQADEINSQREGRLERVISIAERSTAEIDEHVRRKLEVPEEVASRADYDTSSRILKDERFASRVVAHETIAPTRSMSRRVTQWGPVTAASILAQYGVAVVTVPTPRTTPPILIEPEAESSARDVDLDTGSI